MAGSRGIERWGLVVGNSGYAGRSCLFELCFSVTIVWNNPYFIRLEIIITCVDEPSRNSIWAWFCFMY